MTATIKALLVIVGYMLARAFIYARLPGADYADWFWRDIVMTLPRTAGFLLSLLILRKMAGTFWLKIKGFDGAAIVAGVLAGEAFAISAFPWVLPFSEFVAQVGWATTLAVAFFEETCFRGVLFQSLKERMTPLKAALAATLIFTAYHIQAQPITTWPGVFLVGFSFCAAYYRGVGLIWLVIAHELIDGFYLHVNSSDLQRVNLYVIAYTVLAVTGVYSASRLRKPCL